MTRIELWTFLNGRACEQREQCVKEWQAARANTQRLQEHTVRLDRLLNDYGERQLALQTGDHQVHQTAELRHTVRQLLGMRQRAGLELQAAQAHEEQWRQRMQRAEGEVLKTRTLQEQAQREARREEDRTEQRRADALAIGRHWARRLADETGT